MADDKSYILRLLVDGQWIGVSAIVGPKGEAITLNPTVDGNGNAVTGLRLFDGVLTVEKQKSFLTEIVKGVKSGVENAVSDIKVEGNSISLVFGKSFLTEHQDISGLQTKAIDDSNGNFTTDTVEGALRELGAFMRQSRIGAPIVEVTGDKTLMLSDAGSFQAVTVNNMDAMVTITIPADADVAFATATELEICQLGVSPVVIAPAEGVTIVSTGDARQIEDQNGSATLKKLMANVWHLGGALA